MKLREQEVVEQVGRVSVSELRVWVSEGWIAPEADAQGYLFSEIDVARIRLVCQLREDCDLTADAMPVVLSLIDQIHGLRRELRTLAQIVGDEPDDVRRRIHQAFRARLDRSNDPVGRS